MWLLSYSTKAIIFIILLHFCELHVSPFASLDWKQTRVKPQWTSAVDISLAREITMWPFGRPPIFITDPRKYDIRTMRLRVAAKKPHSYCASVEKKSFICTFCQKAWGNQLRGSKHKGAWSYEALWRTQILGRNEIPQRHLDHLDQHHSTNFWSEPDMFAESRHMKGRIHDTVQARVNQANYSRCSKQFFRLSSCASRIQILHALVAIASQGVCTK